MTVGMTLLVASATGVTVGAAAYSRNVATPAADAPATANVRALLAQSEDIATVPELAADESNRAGIVEREVSEQSPTDGTNQADAAKQNGPAREVAPGIEVKVGQLQVGTHPSGVKATALPMNVTNTGARTKSVDITVEALDPEGAVITSDVGTATNLRPGQTAEVQVMEIVGDEMAERLAAATFEVSDTFTY